MLTKCPKCHAQQPYQLNRASFEKPFACCKCGYIFAGLVYEPATKSLQLDATQASCIADTTKLARYADEVLILAFEVDRTSWNRGHGRFAIAKADLLRDYSQYAGFVTSVLDALQPDRQQFALPLDNVAKVGRGIPVLLLNRRKCSERRGGKKGERSNGSRPCDATTHFIWLLGDTCGATSLKVIKDVAALQRENLVVSKGIKHLSILRNCRDLFEMEDALGGLPKP